MKTAIEFLRHAASDTNPCRIVSTNDLDVFQIGEARAQKRMFVDEETGLGWVMLPWDLTTGRDRKREAYYFSRNNMMR